MSLITSRSRATSRRRLSDPDRRHRADFARAAVFAEFGRHAFAIDQGDFVDHKPTKRGAILIEGRRI